MSETVAEPDPLLDAAWDDQGDEGDSGAEPASVTRAVVTATDWTTETILSQLRRGNIQLNPRFQRRDAWDIGRKSRFIESLVLGLPIPQLVLAENRARRGSFIVLDGKQRLLALQQFAQGSSVGDSSPDSPFVRLELRELEVRAEDLTNYSLIGLEEDPSLVDDLNAFLNQTIRTVVVRNWPDENFLNLVFLRLNTGSVQLSPQELRQALHPGRFTDFLDDFSADSEPIQRALRIKAPDFRMRDIEILLRYFAFSYYLGEYKGDLKKFLDAAVENFNKSWETNQDELRSAAQACNEAIEAVFEMFGRNAAFFRWDGRRYERRFNRAIFDVMTYYFSRVEVREAALNHAEEVVAAFEDICENDQDFLRSVQTTTKTQWAVTYRLHAWGEKLRVALPDVALQVPEVVDTRLRT